MIFSLPVVEDTIDHAEKVKFLLFDNLSNDNYLFSIISEKQPDTVITHYTKTDTLTTKITSAGIASILNNVIKLDNYYNSVGKKEYNTQTNYSFISNPDAKTNAPDNKLDSILVAKPASNADKIKKNVKNYIFSTGNDNRSDKDKAKEYQMMSPTLGR